MAVSKEGLNRVKQADAYNREVLTLDAQETNSYSYFANASDELMKSRKTDRSPNSLCGCRVRLRDDGTFQPC